MSIKDQIKAEIERRMKTQLKRNPIGVICGTETIVDADEILAFIDSLPEEQPSEDLEKVAKRIAYDVCSDLPSGEQKDTIVYYATLAAIAGANLQKEQIMKDADEDEKTRVNLMSLLADLRVGGKIREETYQKYYTWLKSLRGRMKEGSEMESYGRIERCLSIAFMNFLDENRPKGKMCLSNGECADIDKAFSSQDWGRLARYMQKYS